MLYTDLFSYVRLAIIFMLIFSGIDSVNATVAYDGQKILVTNGPENITSIKNNLNNDSILEQLSGREWLLKKPLQINSGGILYINNSDTIWLKLLSLNDSNEAYIFNSRGTVIINNTKITSWNSKINNIAPDTDTYRGYVHSESHIEIINSNLSYLGKGVGWNRIGVSIHSDSSGSIIHNNTLQNNTGLLFYISDNIIISNNFIIDTKYNVGSGMDIRVLNANTSNFSIINNTITRSDHSGSIYIERADNYTIQGNYLYGVGINALLKFENSIIKDNIITDENAHGHLEVHGEGSQTGKNVIVENNTVFNNVCLAADGTNTSGCHGIYIHNVGINNITIKNNTVYNNAGGTDYYLFQGYNLVMENNTGWGSSTSLQILNVNDSIIRNNNLSGSIYDVVIGFDTTYAQGRPSGWGYTTNNVSFLNNRLQNGKIRMSNGLNNGTISLINNTNLNGNTLSLSQQGSNANLSSYEIRFPDGKIFSATDTSSASFWNSTGGNIYYANKPIFSNIVTLFPMTARPTTSPATVPVTSFNTSLPAGNVLANFTANTTNGNTVAFTMSTLKPGKRYLVNVNGSNLYSPIADTDGVIRFSHSSWPAGVFTVVEDTNAGNITVMTLYVNNTLLTGASVALTRGGILYDVIKISPANGTVQFKNVPAGTYSVNVTKGNLYGSNSSTVSVTDKASINMNIYLRYFDLNYDGKINVLDPSTVMAHYLDPGRPVYDVNGDGMVNVTDTEVYSDIFDQ